MKNIVRICIFFGSILFIRTVFGADVPTDIGFHGEYPESTILDGDGMTVVGVLALIQSLLLMVGLPVIIIGGWLYAAYELFTAEWDETKMKKAWKSVTFSAIGLVCIAVSYAFVSVLARISL